MSRRKSILVKKYILIVIKIIGCILLSFTNLGLITNLFSVNNSTERILLSAFLVCFLTAEVFLVRSIIKQTKQNYTQNNLNETPFITNNNQPTNSVKYVYDDSSIILSSDNVPLTDYKITVNTIINQPDPEPVEKLIKGCIPSKNGLMPHEILILSYADKFTTGKNNFQRFWIYQYGVENVKIYLNKLVKLGFIEEGNLLSGMSNSTVAVLKDCLKAHSLKISGRKDELIDRLYYNVPHEELQASFSERPYKYTAKGRDELLEEGYVDYVHRRNGFLGKNIFEINKIVKSEPIAPWRCKLWTYCEQQKQKYSNNKNYGSYINCLYIMSNFADEDENYDLALELLLEASVYELSGVSYAINPETYLMVSKEFFPYEESIITITHNIYGYENLKNDLNLNNSQFYELIKSKINKYKLDISIFTPEECADIILLEMNNEKDALKKLYLSAENRFQNTMRGTYI